jgi:hypothetical protein
MWIATLEAPRKPARFCSQILIKGLDLSPEALNFENCVSPKRNVSLWIKIMALVRSVYGLGLHLNMPVAGLISLPATSRVDVHVWLGLMPPCISEISVPQQIWYLNAETNENGQSLLTVWKLADGAYFRLLYADGTQFVVDQLGTQVWATWPQAATVEDTATYLLGPVLGFVLRLRGVTCLHASAVAIDNQAVTLLGPAGAGKSTTAAAFAKLGYPILSDDVIALSDVGDEFFVQPAYPRVRLWPESVDSLFGSREALPRLTPTWDKRYLDLVEDKYQFQQEPLPLAVIYILSKRSDDPHAPFIEKVSPQDGLMTLITNTYINYMLEKSARAKEFILLNQLVSRVLLRKVTAHTDPKHLPNLCRVITQDFQKFRSSHYNNRRLTKQGFNG